MADLVTLIDYGAGNLHSVNNALKAAGARNVQVTSDPDMVAMADHIVLPGVGAFGSCRDALMAIDGMVEAMTQRVRKDARPFLGICVGMQLLADMGTERGTHDGLGWIAGKVTPIEPASRDIKVPHMGWNDVTLCNQPPLLETGEAYYLHSYHFEVSNPTDIAAKSDHGGQIVAAVARDNIMGVQFHPEKSQQYGLAFLGRFLEWKP